MLQPRPFQRLRALQPCTQVSRHPGVCQHSCTSVLHGDDLLHLTAVAATISSVVCESSDDCRRCTAARHGLHAVSGALA